MSKKKSATSTKATNKSGASAAGKGRATPKQNATRNADNAAKAKNANMQWFIIGAVLVAIVAAIIVFGTIYGDPYDPLEYLEADAIRRQEARSGG